MDGNTLAWWFFGIVAFVAVVIATLYAFVPRNNNDHLRSKKNKQDFVVNHMDSFGVKNRGSSLDEDELFVIDYDALGL